jgi:hypothetical protein
MAAQLTTITRDNSRLPAAGIVNLADSETNPSNFSSTIARLEQFHFCISGARQRSIACGDALPRQVDNAMRDTAAFAVESIRRWWQQLGQARYPEARRLVITADCGGSNGVRVRLWKRELQRFANETGLAVTVAHLPSGTSKWNRIEHRLFAAISQNWRGKPLVSHQVIVQLIGATTTQTGLTVRCELDANRYPKGIKVTDAEMAALAIERDPFHGEWNYAISPNQQPP